MANIRHDRMLWLDIETSDTDEQLQWAALLEVGITITDFSGRKISEQSFVNHLDMSARANLWKWPSEVRKMHTANGLIDEAMGGEGHINIDADIRTWFRDWEVNDNIIGKRYNEALDGRPLQENELITLAGSGVSHFDRRWVKKYLPMTDELLTHFAIDVGVLRRMTQMHASRVSARVAHRVARGFSHPQPHRALDCNARSIAQYRAYVDLFRDMEGMENIDERRQQTPIAATPEVAPRVACGHAGPGDTCTYAFGHDRHSWQ